MIPAFAPPLRVEPVGEFAIPVPATGWPVVPEEPGCGVVVGTIEGVVEGVFGATEVVVDQAGSVLALAIAIPSAKTTCPDVTVVTMLPTTVLLPKNVLEMVRVV
jgi:hypothetical protein